MSVLLRVHSIFFIRTEEQQKHDLKCDIMFICWGRLTVMCAKKIKMDMFCTLDVYIGKENVSDSTSFVTFFSNFF